MPNAGFIHNYIHIFLVLIAISLFFTIHAIRIPIINLSKKNLPTNVFACILVLVLLFRCLGACKYLNYFQNSRSRHILALVPEENAPSEISGESSSENEKEAELISHYERHDSESSEAPSITSSLAELNLLDSSNDEQIPNESVSLLVDFNPEETNHAEQQQPFNDVPSISSLPTLSPMSNIPSITPSFIINQVSGSPQQSPQISASTPQPTRTTRARRRRNTTANLTVPSQTRRVTKKKI